MNKQKGFTLLFTIIVILSISFIIVSGLTFLTASNFASVQNKVKSTQSYYAAETGIEDYLYRLREGMETPSSNTFNVDGKTITVILSEPIGGARIIVAEGNTDNRIRKVSAVYTITSEEVSFHYGTQAGEGGIRMGNNSQVQGNVFSNGNITGGGEITGTAIIAFNGNEINGIEVGGDAHTYNCTNSNINGTLNYVTGGTITNCTYSDLVELEEEITNGDLPITDEQITNWENAAAGGGTITGDYAIAGGDSVSMGPIKITGDLTINNNATLNTTGTIYVEGNINTNNNATIKLDSGFGSDSGVILSDGKINIDNNVNLQGSGITSSYLLLLSTNNSLDPMNPAIDVDNNAEGAVFYASNGIIRLRNNISAREATGYQIRLDNNAVITYETGLQDLRFPSGPGGSWSVANWQEVE
ncbi:MAG: type II secretion system protein [bacterium]